MTISCARRQLSGKILGQAVLGCLSAVSGAPCTKARVCTPSYGALLIQRLEGSRPHGGLCILNGAGRVRRLEEVMVQGMIHPVECGTELREVAQRCRAAAVTSNGRGVSAS